MLHLEKSTAKNRQLLQYCGEENGDLPYQNKWQLVMYYLSAKKEDSHDLNLYVEMSCKFLFQRNQSLTSQQWVNWFFLFTVVCEGQFCGFWPVDFCFYFWLFQKSSTTNIYFNFIYSIFSLWTSLYKWVLKNPIKNKFFKILLPGNLIRFLEVAQTEIFSAFSCICSPQQLV